MSNILNWFLQDKKQQSPVKFVPKIIVNPKSTLYIEVQPKDPCSTSNIVVTAFASQQVRSIIPVRVQWSRFKMRSESAQTLEKIHCLVGNTYMCEPSDVGGYIRAVVRSLDESIRAEAEVTIGPIGIDVMIKRVIDGALYAGSLLSQVIACQKDKKKNITVRIFNRTIEFVDDMTQQKIVKDYSISEPKIQLNPKDSTRVYLRFQQDQNNTLRQWLNRLFDVQNESINESSMSIRVPYSSHSSNSSKMRLFQKSHGPCPNKIEIRFISRHSRDLFLFTHRAFICRQDMKNSVYIQRIQSLLNISTEQDYYKFLQFMSLKQQIWRIAEYAKQVEEDRDTKVKDLITMEQSIGEMTLTYLKIIQDKGKHDRLDLEQSYSQINNTRQQILNRKNVRELKNENQHLKQRLRQMNEEIQLLKFFKREDNQSMIFNQTSNPFAKKNNDLSVSYQINGNSPQKKSHRNNMYQISINYANLLQQNRQLKLESKQRKGQASHRNSKNNLLDRSQNMVELLGSLDEREEQQRTLSRLNRENGEFKRKIIELQRQLEEKTTKGLTVTKPNKSFAHQQPSFINNISSLNQSVNSNATDSFLNNSITSQVAMLKLQQNLQTLSKLNEKLQEDTTRLRRERDYYRSEVYKLQASIKDLQPNKSNRFDDSMSYRYKEEFQNLQNQKKALEKKLESLSRQNPQGLKEQFVLRQRKIKELQLQVEILSKQNAKSKHIQSPEKSQELQIFEFENGRLKKINNQLLEQIKNLKIQLENRTGENMYNSRVIELQNQLNYVKTNTSNHLNGESKILLDNVNELTKQIARLRQENSDKQIKLQSQALTIEKMMIEHSKEHNTPQKNTPSLTSTNSKQKCYSEKCNQSTIEEVQKYRRQVKKLQQQIIFMKKSADVINRSRDLTMEMDGYNQEKIDIMKKQMQALYLQNQNLSKMCERYGRDARQANKQLNKWRQKAMNLMKAKHQESSMISN